MINKINEHKSNPGGKLIKK